MRYCEDDVGVVGASASCIELPHQHRRTCHTDALIVIGSHKAVAFLCKPERVIKYNVIGIVSLNVKHHTVLLLHIIFHGVTFYLQAFCRGM